MNYGTSLETLNVLVSLFYNEVCVFCASTITLRCSKKCFNIQTLERESANKLDIVGTLAGQK